MRECNSNKLRIKLAVKAGTFFIILLLFSTSFYHLLALDLVNNVVRDNFNYLSAYEKISACWDLTCLKREYEDYQFYIGSSEPMFFIFSKISIGIGIGYSLFVFFINVFFITCLAMYVSKFKICAHNLALVLIYISFDSYIFVLFSELHRLKLAVCFLLFFLYFNSKFSAIAFSLFSHFQSALFTPIYYRLNVKNLFFLSVFFIVAFFIFQDIIHSKLYHYGSRDMVSFYKTILIFLAALFITRFVFCLKIPVFYYLSGFGVIFMSYLVGGERVNFIIVELFFIYLFLNVKVNNLTLIKKGLLFVLLIFICGYNIYKSIVQYNSLI